MCALSGCTLADVDALAVDVGPGLFTGLRVGVATAKALGQALGLDVLGVTSLDILAAGARDRAGRTGPPAVVAVVDARRREVFAAAYTFADRPAGAAGDVDPADGRDDRAEALSPRRAGGLARDLAADGPVLVVGDGAVRYLDCWPRTRRGRRPGRRAVGPVAGGPGPPGRPAAGRRGWWRRPPAELVPDYRRQRTPASTGRSGPRSARPGRPTGGRR